MSAPTWARTGSRGEWMRLAGFGAAVAGLHVAGWGPFLSHSGDRRALSAWA